MAKKLREVLKDLIANPKMLASGALIAIGSAIVPLQAQQFSIGAKPLMEQGGSGTIHVSGISIKQKEDFWVKALELKYGKDLANKIVKGTYNVGLQMGTNSFLINNKSVPDKLYEQLSLAASLSEIGGQKVNLSIGYNTKINNYELQKISIMDPIRNSTIEASTKIKGVTTGGTLTFNKGKLVSHTGIGEVSLGTVSGKPIFASLAFSGKPGEKLINQNFQLQGKAIIKSGKLVFIPSASVIGNKSGNASGNIGLVFSKGNKKLVFEYAQNLNRLKDRAIFLKGQMSFAKKAEAVKKKELQKQASREEMGKRFASTKAKATNRKVNTIRRPIVR